LHNLKSKINLSKHKSLGFIFFYLSIFLLASVPFFSTIFLFLSFLIGFSEGKKYFIKNRFNIFFFICGILILISGVLQVLFLPNDLRNIWDSNLTFIGMFNWIPFFCFFWTSQIYLRSEKDRKIVALILISGSFPVLISGLGQYFLNWEGPLKALNGLIIWYQKPITIETGLSGLFSNQNYTAAWLLMIWPFSLALILERTKKFSKKLISFFFSFLIFFSIILTHSRSAWAGLLLSFPILLGINNFSWIIPLLIFIFTFLFLAFLPFQFIYLQYTFRDIFNKLLYRVSNEGFENYAYTRPEIWSSAIENITLNPIFGTGAGSFPTFYEIQNGVWVGHPHNLFLELSISYGIPVALLSTCISIYILIISSRKLKILKYFNNESNLFDKAWWFSAFIFFILQTFDIQYFDLRLSILFWILLSGLINIINSNNNNLKIEKVKDI